MEQTLIVYRRDGCGYCRRLETALQDADVTYERKDIWDDPEAAAFVRSVNRGNEVVPTVVFPDGQVHTNPAPRAVLEAAGHPARPGPVRRWLSSHKPE